MHLYVLPKTIISDNDGCFTATPIADFMKKNGIIWTTIRSYAPMTNGKTERMVQNIQNKREQDVRRLKDRLGRVFSSFVYGIRRRLHSEGVLPSELIFGVVPSMFPADPFALVFDTSYTHHKLEPLSSSSP